MPRCGEGWQFRKTVVWLEGTGGVAQETGPGGRKDQKKSTSMQIQFVGKQKGFKDRSEMIRFYNL